MKIKVKLHKRCLEIIEEKMVGINESIQSIEESRNNETKSSAGDKYETSRAMLHIEEEKSRNQLAKTNELRLLLQTIDPMQNSDDIILGSLVKCSTGQFYISAPLGKVNLEGENYYCISMASPIGKLLKGQKIGQAITFGNKEIQIIEIS